jgi:hypothetical protein
MSHTIDSILSHVPEGGENVLIFHFSFDEIDAPVNI